MALTRDKVFWDAFVSHANKTVRAAHLLQQLFEVPADAERLSAEISVLENECDKITHETMVTLHQTWVTPLGRDEIHTLISKLDDVLDYIEAASERVVLYQIDAATPESLELTRVLVASTEAIAQAVTALPNLKESKRLLALCVEIDRLETEADKILRQALARLFRKRTVNPASPIDPVDVMKWRDLYEILETATDRAEDVANVIEGIVLEHG